MASHEQLLGRYGAFTPARARSWSRELPGNVAKRRANAEGGARHFLTPGHDIGGFLQGHPGVTGKAGAWCRICFERHSPPWFERCIDVRGRKDTKRRLLTLGEHLGPSAATSSSSRSAQYTGRWV